MTAERNFVEPAEVDTFAFDWGRLALTVAPSVNGASRFSGGVVDLGPGQGHARHNHPGAEEIIFVVSGEGEQMVEDPSGRPVVRKVRSGSTVYVPESRFHSTTNTGSESYASLRRLFAGRPGRSAARAARLPARACGLLTSTALELVASRPSARSDAACSTLPSRAAPGRVRRMAGWRNMYRHNDPAICLYIQSGVTRQARGA